MTTEWDFLLSLDWDKLDFVLNYRFDLQRFAAEDEGRTEEPTEYKRKKARDEGNVPKSQELIGIIVFLLTFWTVVIMGRTIYFSLVDIMNFYFHNLLTINLTRDEIPRFFIQMLTLIGRIVVPIMVVGIISAVLANIVQTGFVFSTKKIQLNFGKLFSQIGQNLKKMFWSQDTLFNLIKSLVKVVGVFLIAYLVINNRAGDIIYITRFTITQSLKIIAQMVFQFVSFTGIMLLAFALVDYMYQRWSYTQSLKMTKQEVKEEFKEHEGNPEIKAKIREMERRLLSRKMIQAVPTADVVITNPTHYAVAVKYDGNYMTAPTVVAKGMGMFAQRIKEVAKENNVYMVENVPLARALYYQVEVGQEIPREFWDAVINILKTLYQMRQSLRAS